MIHTRPLFALLFVVALTWTPANAQTTWIESTSDGPTVHLEWTKPHLTGDANANEAAYESIDETPATSRLLLLAQYPISDAVRLVADVPISHFESETTGATSTNLGNPYLGGRYSFNSRGAVGGGVRFPVMSEFGDPEEALSSATGSLSDPYRAEAYTPDAFTARSYLDLTFRPFRNISFRIRPGGTLLVPTGDEDRDTQVVFDYSGRVWYDISRLRTGLGFGGRTNVTQENLDDRSTFFLRGAVQARFGRIRPGIVARVPIDVENADYAVGATVGVAL